MTEIVFFCISNRPNSASLQFKIAFFFPEESSFGMYYTQLGYSRTLPEIRTMMEIRTGVTGKALRIEHAIYCPREGKSKSGCPVAKEVSLIQ